MSSPYGSERRLFDVNIQVGQTVGKYDSGEVEEPRVLMEVSETDRPPEDGEYWCGVVGDEGNELGMNT